MKILLFIIIIAILFLGFICTCVIFSKGKIKKYNKIRKGMKIIEWSKNSFY